MSAPYQYIVLHESNQRGVLICQAVHAAGESMLVDHVRDYKPEEIHAVVLESKSSADLEALGQALAAAGIPHVVIHEPDEPYNGIATAVGVAPNRDRNTLREMTKAFKVLR